MSTFYIQKEQKKGNQIEIIGEDYKHLKQVLRYKVGDELEVCDEMAIRYLTKIARFEEKSAVCEIQNVMKKTTESPISITLYQGVPKSDKLEQIIQKTTEIGVSEVIPVEMERSIAKLEEKKLEKKLERWNKIALEASKQSGRQIVPKVQEVIKFKNIIENISKYDIVLLLYENEESLTIKSAIQQLRGAGNPLQKFAVVVGPEGGFSEEEVKMLSKFENVKVVTLGPRILRTETAGVATLAMLIYEFEL